MAILTAFATAAGAAESAAAGESQQDELSRRATDPTASPLTFSLINDVTFSYRDRADGTTVDDTGYAVRFQPVIPFKIWGVANILRMTVPYQVSGPTPEGLGDVTMFDLVVLPQSWGRLGIGVVGSFAAATSDVSAHASAGRRSASWSRSRSDSTWGSSTRTCSATAYRSPRSSQSPPTSSAAAGR
jgi:hypothetical protein